MDNPQAFPGDWNDLRPDGVEQIGSRTFRNPGMSLRDYFAAHAPVPSDQMALDDHCAYRYRYADAMLEARATQPT